MRIRAERPEDHDAVRELVTSAFGPEEGPKVATLVDLLREREPGVPSFVAEVDGVVAGHTMFPRCLLDAPERLVDVRVLSPLAVLPAYRRNGVGKALISEGIAELDNRGVPFVFLEGDPAYYARRGFVPGGPLGFRKPSLRIPDEAFQVMSLSAAETWMTGTLVYASAFWELDCVGLR